MYTWKSYFVIQADYQHWANEALFTALARLRPEALETDQGLDFRSIHLSADHMLGEVQLWLARLQGAVMPSAPRELQHPVWRELQTTLRHETRNLEKWLEAQPDSFFEGEVRFNGNGGAPRTLWVRDVLTHLFSHFAYLRGQLSAAATRQGAPCPELDFVHYRHEMAKLLHEARQLPR
ncbi:MAG: DinB family protein [Gallionellaceae bacterium]|nr:DinB family protein [Gallionellaceae bacterium]